MCGRFALTISWEALLAAFAEFDFEFGGKLQPRYNIAPSQNILVIPNLTPRIAGFVHWGLIPSWAKDRKVSYKMINARGETLGEKPSFKDAYRKRRCLIPADGFYEWKKEGKQKIPNYIRMKSNKVFAFAGIWENWISPEQEKITSCTIITTSPNSLMEQIHNRMPVILPQEHFEKWLNSEPVNRDELDPLLHSFPAELMEAYPVSDQINSPRNDNPNCIEPIPTQLHF